MSVAKMNPAMLMRTVTQVATSIACIPACAAASGFFSPTRLATIAVAAILIPMASE
jgi:hypothetical protein